MSRIPRFVEERIRRPMPANLAVVPGSTPVVSFGDFRKAKVATLGWNPSKNEFLERSGHELDGDDRRLETWHSIGLSLLQNPRQDAAELVWNGCQNYFHRNHYHWFNKLEQVLKGVGASYWDGTACHLDLVQWATNPVWRDLTDRQKQELLDADVPFLTEQLRRSAVRLLLLNGSGIINACEQLMGGELRLVSQQRSGRVRLLAGNVSGTRVLGWNINLQSSRGVKNAEIKWICSNVKFYGKRT